MRVALPFILAAALLAAGCDDKQENLCGVCPSEPDRATPEKLLAWWFETTYSSKDSAGYAEALHPDFRYRFDEADAESLGDCVDSSGAWGRDAEIASAWAMFGSPDVGVIVLSISIDSKSAAHSVCVGCVRFQTTATLRVVLHPTDPDPLTLAVDSPQDFIVVLDPADSTQWVILRQEDVPAPGGKLNASPSERNLATEPLPEPLSWDRLKRLYGPHPPCGSA